MSTLDSKVKNRVSGMTKIFFSLQNAIKCFRVWGKNKGHSEGRKQIFFSLFLTLSDKTFVILSNEKGDQVLVDSHVHYTLMTT